MSDKAIIQVQNLSKKYRIGNKSGDLRQTFKNMLSFSKKDPLEIWALKDINFEVNQGEVFGIIGPNGSGKSTLLKILSKITYPTSGKAILNGRVSSLLEVGTGFHPELTGRENIYLNGSILGMKRAEIKKKFDEIVDFSGVEQFIDTPVKHYSSGMYVRLAFSVAAHLEPEILLVDEVLSVGDMAFREKSLGKMNEVAQSGRTVLFVSHNLGVIKNICNKGIFLNNSKIVNYGPINKVIESYRYRDNNAIEQKDINNQKFIIEEIIIYDKNRLKTNNIPAGENVLIEIIVYSKIKIEKINLKLEVRNTKGEYLFVCNNYLTMQELFMDAGINKYELVIKDIPLNIGDYYIDISIIKRKLIIFKHPKVAVFKITNSDYYPSKSLPSSEKQIIVNYKWII